MPDLHPVVDLGGPISDHRHVGDPASTLQSLHLPAAAPPSALGWAGQLDPRVVDRLLDRFGAQLPLGLVGEPDHQLVGDLFRTPPLGQQLRNDTAEFLVTLHAAGA